MINYVVIDMSKITPDLIKKLLEDAYNNGYNNGYYNGNHNLTDSDFTSTTWDSLTSNHWKDYAINLCDNNAAITSIRPTCTSTHREKEVNLTN